MMRMNSHWQQIHQVGQFQLRYQLKIKCNCPSRSRSTCRGPSRVKQDQQSRVNLRLQHLPPVKIQSPHPMSDNRPSHHPIYGQRPNSPVARFISPSRLLVKTRCRISILLRRPFSPICNRITSPKHLTTRHHYRGCNILPEIPTTQMRLLHTILPARRLQSRLPLFASP